MGLYIVQVFKPNCECPGITRESSEVRCHALRSLKDVLHSNQDIVNTIVLGR